MDSLERKWWWRSKNILEDKPLLLKCLNCSRFFLQSLYTPLILLDFTTSNV
ncbi:MAG: hypothetical protein ACR2PB_03685 [Desulfocapsaceae bacterium]